MFCCLLISNFILSQTGFISDKSLNSKQNYVIKSWDSENGLPQNSVISCLQTSDGYLWFSTQEGLMRFDGQNFKLFNVKNTPALTISSYKFLLEDSRQVLWLISMQNKLVKYKNGVFQTLKFKEPITAICENEDKELVVSGASGNLYLLKDSLLSPFLSLKNQYIHKLIYNNQKELYILSEKGFFLYSNKKLSELEKFSKEKPISLKADENGTIWLLTHQGVYKLIGDDYISLALPKELSDLKYNNDFYVVNEQHVLVNTNSGLFILKNNSYEKIDFTSGLSSNATTVLYKDKENNIWVGTANSGINKLKEKTIITYDETDGLNDNGCGALLKLNDNSVLISNYCKDISVYKNNRLSNYNTPHFGCIWALGKDKENNLWVGTYSQGLFKLKNNDSTRFYSKSKAFRNDYFSIFQDSRNNIWLGTDDGLYKYDNNTISRIHKEQIKGKISYITEDRKNHLWICSDNGLVSMTTDNVKVYTTKDGLPGNKVRHVYEDKEGTLWISTYDGGIARLKNKRFFAFNESEKIIDNFTSCIVEDDDNHFWISSNRGIYRASKKNLNEYADGKSLFIDVTYFGREDGMKSSECNGGFQYAGLKLEDGKIMFPTVSGLALVNPKRVTENLYEPKIIFENIFADEKALPLTDSIITLNNIRNLEINFTAPYFGDSKNLLFECRLEGYDLTWRKPSTEKSISYYNLPPGEYIFKIAVYGYVNEKKIHFNVPYPFWQTGLFYIILAVSATIIFFTVVFFRTRSIRKKETLKTEINKQYAALELKALQSQMNPHFMFNCLNTIKYFITTDDKSSANKYLGKFSKLIRLFLEHANSNSIKLSEELHILSLYIEMEQLRLDNSFHYQLNINPDIDQQKIEIPTMLLQPYVENAIHHGLRNKTKGGLLVISIIFEENLLTIFIDDNGIGREKANEIKQASEKDYHSMGMKITAERIETLNYIKNTHIETQIIDKININGIAEGTTVVIRIPIYTDYHD